MKRMACVWVLLAALALVPAAAMAEMYIEGYIGGVGVANDSQSFSAAGSLEPQTFTRGPAIPDSVTYTAAGALQGAFPGRFDNPFFTGGMKLGIWFDRTGITGGYAWPDWMKYLGFYLDLSYHNVNLRRQQVTGRYAAQFQNIWESSLLPGDQTIDQFTEGAVGTFPGQFSSRGRMFTLAFMFAGRLGFFPDSEVPFGRLQPYLAVGPALFVSSQSPSFSSNFSAPLANTRQETIQDGLGIEEITPGVYTSPNFPRTHNVRIVNKTKSSVDLGLAVDAGFRYYALKNVSIDVFFKYRWVEPKYNYTMVTTLRHPTGSYFSAPTPDPFEGTFNFKLKPTMHMFSGNVGVAYHF